MAFIYNRSWSRQELTRYVGDMDQLAGIRLMEGADGMERGARSLQVRTGSGLCFKVAADRAMDITACHYKGMSLAWISPVGEPHPAFFEANGLEWLRTFPGGLLATCGLDHFGPPCQDSGTDFGLHGRIGNLPARCVNYQAGWVGDEYEMVISGEVRQARVFGENLVMRRRLSTRLGSNRILIEDAITNEGFNRQPHMVLYHINLGFPLVSEHTHLKVATLQTLPRDAEAEKGLETWDRFQPPTPDYREQAFIHTPAAESNGHAKVEVENPSISLGLRLTFGTNSLPYLVEWKMMGEGVYVLGIEPTNCQVIGGRAAASEQGALPQLAPGETRHYCMELEVYPI